ncbi:adenosylhomocysteinase [bacterium]|nr:adenosylhomocysteinase [bacterium]
MNYDIKDIKLAPQGKLKVEWAAADMPVLSTIEKRFKKEKPLKNLVIGACLHVTTETARLMEVLKAGGADVYLCASNPLSTQDDTAAYLAKEVGVSVFAIKGEDNEKYYDHINSVLNAKPNITMDDGADLVSTIHSTRKEIVDENFLGGTEETTTGVIRLNSMAKEGVLMFPIIAVNDAMTKHFFDNRYGTGQSTLDGIVRATNRLYAGSTVVIAGYGWCGRGCAMRAQGMGARVIITEVDPLKALEAIMDGYNVAPMAEACKLGDIFITVTGNLNVIRKEHFEQMKDGAIVCNSGHFNVEIDIPALEKMSKSKRTLRPFLVEHTIAKGKRINLLAEGRLINLAAAEGHPSVVMDMSFCNQAFSAEYLVKEGKKLQKKVYKVPEHLDNLIAKLKLESMNTKIDTLTPEQVEYLNAWQVGT